MTQNSRKIKERLHWVCIAFNEEFQIDIEKGQISALSTVAYSIHCRTELVEHKNEHANQLSKRQRLSLSYRELPKAVHEK